MSPPISLKPKWFENFTAYTIAKFGMSMCVIGMSAEYKKYNIAVNALWPKTAIDTAAIRMLGGVVRPEQCRKVDILADASFFVLRRDSNKFTGKFYIDEEVLAEEGITDLEKYSVKKGEKLSKKNIRSFRPLIGINSNKYFKILGRKAKKDIIKYKPIFENEIN